MTEQHIFQCALCGGVFRSAWTSEQARDEFEERFGIPYRPEECEPLCDACYKYALARLAELHKRPAGRA